jgi:hypothetical protein
MWIFNEILKPLLKKNNADNDAGVSGDFDVALRVSERALWFCAC